MNKNGQAMVWGIGALLIAIGMVLILEGYTNQNLAVLPDFYFVYEDNVLIEVVYNNGTTIQGDSNTTILEENFELSIFCIDNGKVCTRAYTDKAKTAALNMLSLIEYLIAVILIMFGGLSFYMAHKS